MKRLGLLLIPSLVVLLVIAAVLGVNPADAVNTNADYSATPPFVSTVVTPNVLIMLDNSGSMGYRTVCDNTDNNSGFPTKSAASGGITSSGTTATFTATAAHGIPTGTPATDTWVTITGATPAGYNVTARITSVTSTTKFQYTIAAALGATTTASTATFRFGACPTSPALYPSGTPDGAPFREDVTFVGLFDTLSCYTYNTTDTRFDVTSTKATVAAICGTTEWDGNFLNWATFRRHDALKKALIGAQCVAARAADASCPTSGSTAKITIKGEDGIFPSSCCDDDSSAPVTKASCTAGVLGCAPGRVPSAILGNAALTAGALVVTLHASGGTLGTGSFCVGNVTASPVQGSGAAACNVTGAGTPGANGVFVLHASVVTEPLGVVQDLGDKARFGLLEFRNSGDGGKVLVPLGSLQSTLYNTTTVTTYTSNKAAMVIGIEQSLPATSTPLAETFYTGVKYVAQLVQPFGTSASYLYPCAFSTCGPAFAAAQTAGGLGTTESSLLAGGDTCTTGLGYISGACARDPYYFGTNPAWASAGNPKQVVCCKTFIMFLTDGEPTADSNVELDRFLIAPTAAANAVHGPTCTGNYASAPQNLSSSAADQATYVAAAGCFTQSSIDAGTGGHTIANVTLLKKHKTDYAAGTRNHILDELAYFANVTDLRQPTITYPSGATESGHDLSGFQNIVTYPVFAFGNINGREILMQAAKQGGFVDENSDKLGPIIAGKTLNTPDLQTEWDKTDNVTGLLVPDGQPDTYFESQNANDMKDKLLSALTSILQKAASGTSVSVLATSSTGEGAIYQAYFFPTTFVTIGGNTNQVLWTGFTQGLFIDTFGNLREDYSATGCTGNPDGQLVLTHDCIIKIRLDTIQTSPTFGQVLIDRFQDLDGDGLADDRNGDGTFTDGFLVTNGDGILNSVQSPCSTTGTGSSFCAAGPGGTPQDKPSDAIATVTLTTGGISNVQIGRAHV